MTPCPIAPWPPTDPRHRYKGRVIAMGGPPHSGKSVFTSKLYHQLLARTSGSSQVFKEVACPDGEGMWSQEAEPELVDKIRRKGSFTPEFLQLKLPGIERLGCDRPLVLVDIGGLRTAENGEILKRCTHLIIISRDGAEFEPWQRFAAAEGCEAIAYFHSHLVKREDGTLEEELCSRLDLGQQPAVGEFYNLCRSGGDRSYREAIERVAVWLCELCGL